MFCGVLWSLSNQSSFQASCQERNEKLHYHLFPEPQAQSYYDTMPSTHPYIQYHHPLFFFFLLGIPKTIKLTYGSARQCDNRGLPSANLGKEDEKSGGRTDTRSKRKGVTVTEQAEFD